ncbi:MAG TPA: hypothetical protein VIJ38_06240 [Acidobacteriaceae bacterium]
MNSAPQTAYPSKHTVHLPAPTAWPIVLALGTTFLFAGIVMTWAVSLLGVVLMVCAAIGWSRDVLPRERIEEIEVITEIIKIESSRTQVERLPVAESHRKILPVERYTLGAGVRGGIAGGIAMIAPATLYGLIRYGSIWYAPNLLAAIAIPDWAGKSTAFLASYHLHGLLVAIGIHALASVLVGLLYGAILPMFPRRPILTAGFLAPIFWTGLLYGTLEAVSPGMNQRIDWLWFVISQIAFGLVAGFVVNLHVRVRTDQFQSLPFSMRAGILSQGIEQEAHDKDRLQ